MSVKRLLNPIQYRGQELEITIWPIALVYSAVCATAGVGVVAVFFATVFFAATFLAGAAFFAAFADGAVTAAFLAAVFLETGTAFFAAFSLAHLFFKAATMFALPALLSVRLGFAGSGAVGAGGADSPRTLAHLRCWASLIRFSASALNLRLDLCAFGSATREAGVPVSVARSSAI